MKPTLAVDIDFDKATYPLWAFPKLDGVRATNYTGNLLARSLEPHENLYTTQKYSKPEYIGLDGELIVGPSNAEDALNKTSSATRTINWQGDILWYIFDLVGEDTDNLPYKERYLKLQQHVVRDILDVVLLTYTLVNDKEEALAAYNEHIALGYEGTVYRNPDAKRKNGRATLKGNDFLRAKPQSDKEARVLSIYECMENQNEAKTNALGRTERSTHKENLVGKGILGGMVAVDLISGKEIKVAPGKMTHDQRLHLWTHQEEIVGKVVKYRSMDKGVKDQPRFARWIDFRSERDM